MLWYKTYLSRTYVGPKINKSRLCPFLSQNLRMLYATSPRCLKFPGHILVVYYYMCHCENNVMPSYLGSQGLTENTPTLILNILNSINTKKQSYNLNNCDAVIEVIYSGLDLSKSDCKKINVMNKVCHKHKQFLLNDLFLT